ncbi:hypothetical protein BDW02DRAFT_634767 [Decorospora gaudefroyi]|uniref:Heterokaryon incompatibility domain-containing protein n=1 Tax=Decorospora gaudefroyi TaxID=184978 RepID=A0A6A5JWL1_9PLEO|nr:hypothetical protein BDW02DRAFT_634767 [Decorospora gaudefroyi]
MDVWLGIGDHSAEQFFDLAENRSSVDPLNSGHQRAYDTFHQLPYWERAWVVQEMYFARRMRFIYGTRSLTLDEVYATELKFLSYTYGASINKGLTPMRFKNMKELDMTIATDLSFLTSSWLLEQKCGRVLDRIYAFQSLIPKHTRVKVKYDWLPLDLFNALMDKLAETASDHGLSDIEVFANRLDILPLDYARTLTRLNMKIGDRLSKIEIEHRERNYKLLAPIYNPACRGNETLERQISLKFRDEWDSCYNRKVKPQYPGALAWNTSIDKAIE